jgi:hypothetical protein
MAGAVNSGDVLEVVVSAEQSSVATIEQRYHIKNIGSGISAEDAVDDVLEILDALYTFLAALLHVAYTINEVRVRNRTTDEDLGNYPPTTANPGTGSTNTDPPQVAYAITLDTLKWRTRGRKFFGPTINAIVNAVGAINSTGMTALGNVGDYMTDDQAATYSTWQFGVISTLDETFYPFVAYTIATHACTQRRRRVGVGI